MKLLRLAGIAIALPLIVACEDGGGPGDSKVRIWGRCELDGCGQSGRIRTTFGPTCGHGAATASEPVTLDDEEDTLVAVLEEPPASTWKLFLYQDTNGSGDYDSGDVNALDQSGYGLQCESICCPETLHVFFDYVAP